MGPLASQEAVIIDMVNLNLGVNLAPDIINCLFFADDIVLMGKSEHELQTLLNITAAFAS